ncbi:hypothetical protein ABZ949_02180 [Micromonospora tulbaghiae]|uniref:hypothetical protein n=1 Tax=Micromonospora tulbaghiae TaxID=479978 RepID=UPI0033F491FC
MEMILGAMILALWVKTGAAVLADTVTTLRASKAGEWGLIDRQRDRKAAASKSRREAMGKAWQATRARRSKKAGGDGTYRPGMAAYLGDVYHGVWEDALEARKAKRTNRPPVGPDGKRPMSARVDAAVERRVQERRGARETLARVGRALWEPVGENRQPVGGSTDARPPRSTTSGERSTGACPVCKETLTFVDGGWSHPQGSACVLGEPIGDRRPDGGYQVPADVAQAAVGLYRRNRAEGRDGALGETRTAQALADQFGDQHPQHVHEQAAADATHTAPPSGGPWMPDHDDLDRAALDALADCDPSGRRRAKSMDDAYEAVQRAFPNMHPEAVAEAINRADRMPGCNECGQRRNVNPPCAHRQAHFDRLRAARSRMTATPKTATPDPSKPGSTPANQGGTTMNTATGDVHDVETCKSECEALADDLGRVDTALDTIDEAIRSAAAAAERIEAWLQSKNADACVAGMSAVLDALSADNVKELMDAVAAARQGVQDTIDSLAPMEEAAELVGAADGSILNGR